LNRDRLVLGHGLDHGTGTDAPGADVHPLDLAGSQLSPNRLQVGHEATLALVVGVAHIVSNLGSFSTDFTYFGHGILLDRSRKYGQGLTVGLPEKKRWPLRYGVSASEEFHLLYPAEENSKPKILDKKIDLTIDVLF
jgi:hypothetical protein